MGISSSFWSRYRPHNYICTRWKTFLYLLFWLMVEGVGAVTKRGFESFRIEVHTVRPSSVDLTWTCLSSEVIKRWAVCDVIIWTAHDERRNVLENYSLQNHLITVKFLLQKTKYGLFLSCHVNGSSFTSNIVSFETGSQGLMRYSTNTLTVSSTVNMDHVTKIHDNLDKKSLNYSMNHSQSTIEDSPTIYKQKLSAFSNVLDATLGILFAVIGSIVAIVTLCYVLKSYRRRQRVQRFMRHEDNSDQFAIIRQNISESS